MLADEIIDTLLKELDNTVDSLESGVKCDEETRKIVRSWVESLPNNACSGQACPSCQSQELVYHNLYCKSCGRVFAACH